MKIRRGTFQHVESELFGYHDTCREIIRIKNEIINGRASNDENVGGGRSSMPGDPTGRTATLLVTHRDLTHMERIVEAIESVYQSLTPEKQELVKLKYWARPQTLTWDGIALELKCHRATAIRWRDEIIFAIARLIGWK